MSENVGAPLVLAQVLLPAQTGPTSQAQPELRTAGNRLTESGAETQLIDSTGENPPEFAALMHEAANLELTSAARTGAIERHSLRGQADTAAAADAAAATGTPLPESGHDLPETGMLMPPQAALPAAPGAPATPADGESESPTPEAGARVPVRDIALPEDARDPNVMTSMPPAQTDPGTAAAQKAVPPPTPTAALPVAVQNQAPVQDPQNPGRPAEPVPMNGAAMPAGSGQPGGMGQFGDQTSERDRGAESFTPPVAARTSHTPTVSFSLEPLTAAAPPTGPVPMNGTSPAIVTAQTLALQGGPAEWAQPLAERLAGLATRGANTAEVRLHPPNLGTLEVRITLSNDQASVFVASANPDVRDALQQALPRLDNLLNGFGIELGDAEIADRQPESFSDEARPGGSGAADEPEVAAASTAPVTIGLIDTWA